MVATSALVVDDVQRVFDGIEHQFELDTDSLVALTNAFLDEVTRGLANYGHPMAMMCVHLFPGSPTTLN
jgi:hexokinase